MPTKLIEVALPLDAINREAAREKSIRHGHPSTLHLWWARRPLAACRAVLFAQLVDDPSAHPERFPTEEAQDVERHRLFRIIEKLVPWEASNNEGILEEARAEIRKCYPDGPPPIVDPFCGGGSIPLEAQRLGLETHASDLNPVAVLITKALIEIPPQFVGRPPVHPDEHGRLVGTQVWKGAAGLAEDVRWYGNWMRDQAIRRIGHLYPTATPPGGGTATVIAWLWTRTVTCPNPACGATMPLVHSFWLSKKKGKEAWVDAVADPVNKRVRFEIGHGERGPSVEGTVGRTGATCLVCDNPVSLEHVRSEGRNGRMGTQLMAIAAESQRQRIYLPASEDHEAAADVIAPTQIPDAELAYQPRDIKPPIYGFSHHADLFTRRQLTALCTFSNLVREARQLVFEDSDHDGPYSDAVATYLAFVMDKMTDTNSALCSWQIDPPRLRSTFGRQALPMIWDFAEANPFGGAAGDYGVSIESEREVIERLLPGVRGVAVQSDAAKAHFEGCVIATDPPYYDNIYYSDLSDFFYIWLRKSLLSIYPDVLGTILTPKSSELVASPYRFGGSKDKAEEHFERGFAEVFSAAAQQSRTDTPLSIFYAFKQSETEEVDSDLVGGLIASTGWEKMLSGLLRSGLAITGTWPMRTEMGSRIMGQRMNALASSVVLVCRPREPGPGVTDRWGFQQALKARLGHDLRVLQSGGIAPVDLAQAAIGPGMAVFSRYTKVIEADGRAMTIRKALQLINRVLDEVTAEQEGEFDEDTRWAIAWYAEQGMDEGPYGRADDLSRAKNVSVDGLARAGIVKAGGGKVRLLDRSELDPKWNPATDPRLTVWEVTQHLIRHLLVDGEAAAADLLARVGGLGDTARDLAYRLFQIAESRRWAKDAGPYNSLAAAWPELSRRAAEGPAGQGTLQV